MTSTPPTEATTLESFNVVLVCENFPVGALDLSDITFRGRKFREHLRVGPMIQASTRNVSLLVVPDRLQITVAKPDNLVVLSEGVSEVVSGLREYVGRRSITAVGHNIQAHLSPAGTQSQVIVRSMLDVSALSTLLGVDRIHEGQINVVSKLGRETTLRLTLGTDAASGRDALDLNFDFQVLTEGELGLDEAIAELPVSLEHALAIRSRFASETSQALFGATEDVRR